MPNDLIAHPASRSWDRSFGSIEQLDIRHRGFLPAQHARTAQKTPLSSLLLLMTIILMVVTAFIWACVSRIEVVSSASGRVIPSGRAKIIRPKDDGVVRAILVKNGQDVGQGDPLIHIDQTETKADLDRVVDSIEAERLRLARLNAMLSALTVGDWRLAGDLYVAPRSVSAKDIEAERRLMVAVLQAHFATLDGHDQQLASIEAELATTQANIDELQATTPLLRERVTSLEKLVERRAATRTTLLVQQEQLIKREHAIHQLRYEMDRLRAKLSSQRSERDQAAADFRSRLLGEARVTERRLSDLAKDHVKARSRHERKVLRAPIDGVVENLAVFTESGVVEAASDLMTIIPKDASLEIEALADNKDIGFIAAGDQANIKLHAFPFERYGIIEGKVFDVANDAVRAEDGTWRYIVRVHALNDIIPINGREVGLVPGMTADVDIQIDHRRIISFIFEPIIKTLQESLRER